jgi:hypothetical protein
LSIFNFEWQLAEPTPARLLEIEIGNLKVGLTGLEPVTLRLSSACSNQLSYRPVAAAGPPDCRFAIVDFRFGTSRAQARNAKILNRQSAIENETGGKGLRSR